MISAHKQIIVKLSSEDPRISDLDLSDGVYNWGQIHSPGAEEDLILLAECLLLESLGQTGEGLNHSAGYGPAH